MCMFVLMLSHPIFDMNHFCRERFFMGLAWGIFFLILFVWRQARNVYYELLPPHATAGIDKIAEEERQNRGKTDKPAYMARPLKVGEQQMFCKIFGPRLYKRIWGTLAPSKHCALFHLWKNGPKAGSWLFQMGLFMQGIYIAVYLTHIAQYERSTLDMMLQ